MIRRAGGPVTVTPRGLAGTFATLQGPFPGRYRRAVDPHLDAADRLRHRATVQHARQPQGVPPERVRSIPQLLWPDWYARLLPSAGLRGDRARATFANALLLPGLTGRQVHPTISALNAHRGRIALSTVLRGYPTDTQTNVLRLLTRLSDHVDKRPGPIDYQRRRETFPDREVLTWSQWRSLSVEADTHPGNGPDTPGPRGTPRLVHARRYLHTLITGGDLTNPGHPLAWTSPADRSRYHRFTSTMAPQLRRLLRSHARDLLAAAGIDEPLTWTPPAELADGITLPGVAQPPWTRTPSWRAAEPANPSPRPRPGSGSTSTTYGWPSSSSTCPPTYLSARSLPHGCTPSSVPGRCARRSSSNGSTSPLG